MAAEVELHMAEEDHLKFDIADGFQYEIKDQQSVIHLATSF
jgi:hypothetical protein